MHLNVNGKIAKTDDLCVSSEWHAAPRLACRRLTWDKTRYPGRHRTATINALYGGPYSMITRGKRVPAPSQKWFTCFRSIFYQCFPRIMHYANLPI